MKFLFRLTLPARICIVSGLCTLGASTLLLIVGLIAIKAANLTGGVYDPASNGYILDADAATPAVTRATLFVGTPLVLLLSTLAGVGAWAATRRELAALRLIAEITSHITSETLDTRVPVPDVPGDVHTVAVRVNALLARIAEGFARGSRFASNASHELRTPLAASRTILQVALRASPPPEITPSFHRLLALNDRMISTTDALLHLAHAENTLSSAPIPLRPMVAETISLLEPEIARRHLKVTLRLDDLTVHGHPDLVRQLLTNLIRNAIVHNTDGGHIAITVRKESGVTFLVENDGRVIPEARLRTLVEPFERLDERTSGEGHGLGLAIARQIITSQNAEWKLVARPAGGLLVRVAFTGDHA